MGGTDDIGSAPGLAACDAPRRGTDPVSEGAGENPGGSARDIGGGEKLVQRGQSPSLLVESRSRPRVQSYELPFLPN